MELVYGFCVKVFGMVKRKNPEITKAILDSRIFEIIVSLLESESNNKFLNIALLTISIIVGQEEELGVDVRSMFVSFGGDEHLATLANSTDPLVAEKSNIILDQYFISD